jgi:hypothetical protein
MGQFSPSDDDLFARDYSLRSLWAAVRGLPAAALLGVASLGSAGARIPDDWELLSLRYDGKDGSKEAEVYVAPARNTQHPVGIVGLVPGWKRSPADKVVEIEALRDSGHTVLAMPLENPGTKTGSLANSLARVDSFVFAEDSPLYELYPENIPRFLFTHSTSSVLFGHGLMDARMAGRLPPIERAFHTSPFFGSSGSSALYHPTLNKLYTYHARRHENEFTGVSLMDRVYYYVRGLGRLLIEEDPNDRPTHAQVLEISDYTQSYFERKKAEIASGISVMTIPQTFVISTDDPFACPKAGAYAASLENAEITYCQARHNPLLKSSVRNSIIDQIREVTRSTGLHDILAEIEHTFGGAPLREIDGPDEDGPNRYHI